MNKYRASGQKTKPGKKFRRNLQFNPRPDIVDNRKDGERLLNHPKQLYLASPRGFCAGVRRALDTVSAALAAAPGQPVYVLHEIVHNDVVVAELRRQGVNFVRQVEDVPPGAILIFSAHGVAPAIERQAAARGLRTIDATCPLVKRIHRKAVALRREGRRVILIGHRNHPEIEGTLGQLDGEAEVIENAADAIALATRQPSGPAPAFLTQTTLSVHDTAAIVAELKTRWPDLTGGGDICYATSHRQDAVRRLAECCDTILVIGSPKSSNSTRLREVAVQHGVRSWLIDRAREVTPAMLEEAKAVGISAGASAPEKLVAELVEKLEKLGWPPPQTLTVAEENVQFTLPEIILHPA